MNGSELINHPLTISFVNELKLTILLEVKPVVSNKVDPVLLETTFGVVDVSVPVNSQNTLWTTSDNPSGLGVTPSLLGFPTKGDVFDKPVTFKVKVVESKLEGLISVIILSS